MSDTLKAIIAIVLALILGYTVGHWRGVSDGKTLELATHNVKATTEAVKATTDREKVDDNVRKTPDAAIDHELSAGGWLRD